MKYDKKNVDEILNRFLPVPHQEAMESDCDRILHRLRWSAANRPQQESPGQPEGQPAPAPVFSWRVLAMVSVAVLLAVFAGTRIFWWHGRASAVVESAHESVSRIVDGHTEVIPGDKRMEAGQVVLANGPAGALLKLADGSRVEMRSQSELSLERADDGVRIRLHKGSILVTAAKQRSGHLYVQTRDVTASVVGTVFLVNAKEEGSRVAVIQGEVHVQRGETVEKLLPGEQVTTAPSLEPFPVADEITWSVDKVKHLALLQKSTSESNRSAGAKEFEAASIRMSSPNTAEDSGGVFGYYSPGRWYGRNFSLKELIQVAFHLQGFQLSGGPGWMNPPITSSTDRYVVEAKAESNVDRDQIDQMLQTLLVKRFNLKFRREWKESSIYELVVAKGGHKLGEPQQAGIEDRQLKGAIIHSEFNNFSVFELANILSTYMRISVVDRSGISGRYNFKLSFSPQGSRNGDPSRAAAETEDGAINADGDSIFSAIQKQLGLKLHSTKGKVEVLVVESAERPIEN